MGDDLVRLTLVLTAVCRSQASNDGYDGPHLPHCQAGLAICPLDQTSYQ
jgi:hypothetical protein